MNNLFFGDIFDNMMVTSCTINTITQITISGVKSKKWDDEIDNNNVINNSHYCVWKEIKKIVYDVIKGKKTPSLLKVDFVVRSGELNDYGIITLKYEDEKLTLSTGYMQGEFRLDNSMQKLWDKNMLELLNSRQINYRID